MDYFIVWQDRRNWAVTNYDIYGARVAPDGTVLDAAGILIQQGLSIDVSPAVAYSSSNGKYLVAYSRFNDTPEFGGVYRVMARTVCILSCDPFLAYDSHALTDCGNADGVVDGGETVDLSFTVQNTGDVDAINVNGTLSTTTPGITITVGSAPFPDVPAGGFGASLTPFQFVVAPGVACGTLIDFTLDLTYEDGSGNPFSNSTSPLFPVRVGQDVPPLTLLLTDFDDCVDPPTSVCPTCVPVDGNWTVLNNGNKVGWTHAGPGCSSACEWGLFSTNYYVCDSYCPGWTTFHDEELISPVMDMTGVSTVTIRFDNAYPLYSAPTSSDVNVRSSKTGGAWVSLHDFSEPCFIPEPEFCTPKDGTFTLDATPLCAGAPDCQFEFHQVANYYDAWYWGVDNVVVETTVDPVCTNCDCTRATAARRIRIR
jgi:hypothetical protein